jgi:F0F1-type ATP synthase delta subunit
MENAYAQALWNVIEKGMNPQDAVRALHDKLKAEGRAVLLPRIAHAFSRLARTESNRQVVTLTIADKAHEHTAAKDAIAASATSHLAEKDIEVHVDPSLIGGWRLEGREQLIDASYKKHLLAIYTAATHS